MSSLVIVESPAKAKTIKKYLGPGFEVMASYGHVRDLIPKEGAVDPDANFAMRYEVIKDKNNRVDAIAKALRKAESLYLATDPDREGEAISWHLYELLEDKGLLKEKAVHRVVFHEITKRALDEAMKHPRGLSMELINAQQARRALDYLVGFNLSPLLWRKVSPGLSAGRVQSPALRMIVEREEEIERFEPREYWSIESQNLKEEQPFDAKLIRYQGEKVEQFTVTDEATATTIKEALLSLAAGQLLVTKVEKKQRKRNPSPPFTTSTLQQEAVRKLGFTAQRTMRTAQQLYEGIDTGSGAVGLITYMRTDSVNLAAEAVTEIRDLIQQRYGAKALPDAPRQFKTKTKNAQEAHEAIRPTSALRIPDEIKDHLTPDQARLYDLIWKRTVACQMLHATLDLVSVDLACGSDQNLFRANGSTVRDPGFMAVYQEGQDDTKKGEGDERRLPKMSEGELIKLKAIEANQHFTEPPPRYTEASLVKTLEEYGIGRPSTYAAIISTLQNRNYVELLSKRFTPTDMGRMVNRFLTNHFGYYVDYDFTANLEDELDSVSRGEEEWVPLMHNFWGPFKQRVEEKESSVTRQEVAEVRELGPHPKDGRPILARVTRNGPCVQWGATEAEEKPRFASLRPGQRVGTITLEEAIDLLQLPRALGETAENEKVSTSIGRFGPYVKFGSRYVSLKEGDDPYTITLERALELVAEKKIADANKYIQRFEAEGIDVMNGRYGPYITDGTKNAKIPKEREPASLSLEECRDLLAAAPERKGRKTAKSAKSESKKATESKSTKTAKEGAKTASAKKESGSTKKKGTTARTTKAKSGTSKAAPRSKAAASKSKAKSDDAVESSDAVSEAAASSSDTTTPTKRTKSATPSRANGNTAEPKSAKSAKTTSSTKRAGSGSRSSGKSDQNEPSSAPRQTRSRRGVTESNESNLGEGS